MHGLGGHWRPYHGLWLRLPSRLRLRFGHRSGLRHGLRLQLRFGPRLWLRRHGRFRGQNWWWHDGSCLGFGAECFFHALNIDQSFTHFFDKVIPFQARFHGDEHPLYTVFQPHTDADGPLARHPVELSAGNGVLLVILLGEIVNLYQVVGLTRLVIDSPHEIALEHSRCKGLGQCAVMADAGLEVLKRL